MVGSLEPERGRRYLSACKPFYVPFTVGDPTRESDGLAFCVWWCRGWELCALLPGDHLPHTRPHCEGCQLGQWGQLPRAPRVGGRAPLAPA